MAIRVRFFARLRERMGRSEADVESARTVLDVWRQASGQPEPPPNTLCARNMEYATVDTEVSDGDEVAFFPPVSGG